jgi:hypothetical protein
MTDDYEKQATNFLTKHGIAFKIKYVDDKCPLWDDERHIHGDRHQATFSRPPLMIYEKHNDKLCNAKSISFSLYFWNSYNDKQEGKLPTAYAVLACLQKYDPGDFRNFCGDMGFNEDSREAEKTYKAVIKEWEKSEAFFTKSELEELQGIN